MCKIEFDYVDSFNSLLCISNLEGKFLKLSKAWEQVLGRSLDELYQTSFRELIHKEDIEKTDQAIAASLKGDMLTGFTNRYLHKNGTYVWLEWEGSYDAEKELYFAVAKDVTKENELRSLLEQTQEVAKIGSWKFDLLTDKLIWSEQTYSIHEVEVGTEIDVTKAIDFYTPESQIIINERFETSLATGESFDETLQIVTTSGKVKWVRSHGSVTFGDHNRPVSVTGFFQDVDETVNETIESKRLQERLNSVLTNIPGVIYRCDCNRNWTMSYLNEAIMELTGYPASDFIEDKKRSFASIIHPDDRNKVEKVVHDAVSVNEPFSISYRIISKTGEIKHVFEKGRATYDSHGNVKELDGAIFDQTREKLAEKRLADSEKLLNSISHVQSKFIQGEGVKNVFEEVLSSLLTVTGSEYGFIGEVLTKGDEPYLRTYAITDISWDEESRKFYNDNAPNGMEFYNLDSLFGHVIKYRQLVISNEPKNDERACGIPPGHPDLNAFMGIPIFYGEKLVGCVGIANREGGYNVDVMKFIAPYIETTALIFQAKKEKDELISLKEELEDAQYIARIGSWRYDIKNDIYLFTDVMYEIFGIKKGEVNLNRGFFENVVDSNYWQEFNTKLEACVESGAPFETTTKVRLPWGDENYIHFRVQGIYSNMGDLTALSGTCQDVTERRMFEKTILDEKNRAEQATMAKTNFLANMSHEIRTPLNGVLGMSELLKDTSLDDKQNEIVDMIQDCGNGLLQVINDILDISKIEVGKIQLHPDVTFLPEFMKKISGLFELQSKNKGLDFKCSIDPAIQHAHIIDDVRLRQILINLVGNALKFTEKGSISIDLSLLGSEEGKDRIRFCVKDSGIGIAPDKQEKVFNAFDQADSFTTKEFGGTGLGLAIIKSLLKIMGSEIHLSSVVGQGSEFSFELLLDISSSDVVNEKSEHEFVDVSTLSILVAEDNLVNQKLIKRFFEKKNITPDIAGNGKEAVEMAKSKKYDLVFMDIQMPVMDGLEATETIIRELKSDSPYIVALTANVFTEFKEKAFDVGMKHFIGKPVKRDELYKFLESFVREHK